MSLWLNSLVASCCLLVASGQVRAQPIFDHVESIESLAGNSDSVVVGTIVDFGNKDQVDAFGGCPVTILVSETLKGEHHKRLQVRLRVALSHLKTWKNQSHRVLVAKAPLPIGSRAIDLSSADLVALTSDIALLRTPVQVIQHMKKAIRVAPGVTRIRTFSHRLHLKVFSKTKWSTGAGVVLSVPVDARLEARAREYIKSKDTLKRSEGAKAIRYFKSDENIARVTPLLNDSAWGFLYRAEGNMGIEVRHFFVRMAAYETLQYWGISAEKPKYVERVEKFEKVTWVNFTNKKVTIKDLRDLAKFKNLKTIELWNTHIEDGGLKEIVKLKGVKTVNLENAKVTNAEIAALRKLRPDLKIER